MIYIRRIITIIVGIRDYVMDLLLHLVYIHDELSRFSPNSSKSVLTTLVETIYQEFIDSLNKITAKNFSIMGLLQVRSDFKVWFFNICLISY